MTDDFTPRYDYGYEKKCVMMTQSEMYDLVYAAREAEIRFKRLRTKTRAEKDTMDEETYQYRITDCNENIRHYKRMERMLKVRYEDTFGEAW